MKIKPDQYPVIIITTLVLFTILGLALGFRPGHSSSNEEQGIHNPQVEFSSVQFENY